jgi:hypothetical protein
MGGDYSRVRFDPADAFAGVLKQQGRVGLDAEFNEFVELIDRHWRAETLELVGLSGVPHAVPREPPGTAPEPFLIRVPDPTTTALTIGRGRAYVDGILVECRGDQVIMEADIHLGEQRGRDPLKYAEQPFHYGADYPVPSADASKRDLVYLDVWEREVTAAEDPELVENALGGADTATRLQVAWQVKVRPDVGPIDCSDTETFWASERSTAWMTSEAGGDTQDAGPCKIRPGGGYTGLENRLYRVEIHQGGPLSTATFKWSRDNASLTARLLSIGPGKVGQTNLVVSSTGRDQSLRFETGDYVELLDDWVEFGTRDRGVGGVIAKIDDVDHVNGRIIVDADWTTYVPVEARHPRIRRWDVSSKSANENALRALNPGTAQKLEHGITITFGPDATAKARAGDYWIFAARTASGKIDELQQVLARGVTHHYAKLALIQRNAQPPAKVVTDCRRAFPPLTDIKAVDVSVADTCALDAKTLQDVFDRQCAARVLRYVSGDGQEGAPGAVLPGELVVGVEDGFGRPRSGVTVEFTVISGVGSVTAAPITTGTDGLARCQWTLGATAGENEVRAQLAGATRLPIVFHAMAEIQGATEQLPRVVSIGWENDRPLKISQFNGGLRVVFSENMRAQSLSLSTFIVTLELPIDPLLSAPAASPPLAGGHYELIVPGSVVPGANATEWTFKPVSIPQPALGGWRDTVTPGSGTGLGTIQGTIRDLTGAPLPAAVTLTEVNTGAHRGAQASAQGAFMFAQLPAGTYQVEVRLLGFLAIKTDNIVLLAGATHTIDFQLAQDIPVVPGPGVGQRLRCRVTLKAAVILSDSTGRPLDGDAFGSMRPDGTTDLSFPSGDGRRGGDFESWFWLVGDQRPTLVPTLRPTFIPTLRPTLIPTLRPTLIPTLRPTLIPTLRPTLIPTLRPTLIPTLIPTLVPTFGPRPPVGGTRPIPPIVGGTRPMPPILGGPGVIAGPAIPTDQPSLFGPAAPSARRVNEVASIDAAFARKLEANGITTLAALGAMQPVDLSRILGISQVRALVIIDEARRLLNP